MSSTVDFNCQRVPHKSVRGSVETGGEKKYLREDIGMVGGILEFKKMGEGGKRWGGLVHLEQD